MIGLYSLRKKIQERITYFGGLTQYEGRVLGYKDVLEKLNEEVFRLESRKKELEKERETGNFNLDEARGRIDELNFVLGEKK